MLISNHWQIDNFLYSCEFSNILPPTVLMVGKTTVPTYKRAKTLDIKASLTLLSGVEESRKS